jgi:hypothetical protein
MDNSAMGCTSLRTRTRQLRTPIRKPSNREQHERLRSHVRTISLDADASQKNPASSAGSSYIPPIHSEFPHWGDGVIRATREDWHGDTSLTHLSPQGAALDNRRGRLSMRSAPRTPCRMPTSNEHGTRDNELATRLHKHFVPGRITHQRDAPARRHKVHRA